MDIIYGKGASGGIAAGVLRIVRRSRPVRETCTDVDAELAGLRAAFESAEDELSRLYREAVVRVGKREAEIFELHKMMLEDDELHSVAESLIKNEHSSAENAVCRAGEHIAESLENAEDDYMKARAADVRAVCERVAELLCGNDNGGSSSSLTEPSVLAAADLTPAETVMLDRKKVLGFVTEVGSIDSHTAILARTMGIPAIVSVGVLPDSYDGCPVVLDGNEGVLYVEPDEGTEDRLTAAMHEEESERKRLEHFRGKTCILSDGTRVTVSANVGGLSDIEEAIRCDAEGIGLFRSELLFMGRTSPPTEEEQFEIYKRAAQMTNGHECVIRTLDVGADKQIDYLSGDRTEKNPALGLRAIRLCHVQPELLRTQLRALYRAASFGELSVMLPLVVLPEEVHEARAIAKEVQDSLNAEHVPFGRVKLGVMIETPSAAILSDRLAPLSDFFSIGTNDLIQYTMAADREDPNVAYLTATLPESVRRLICTVCDSAKRAGIPVGVCGELAADTTETAFLIRAGVTKLSVTPPSILRVRESVMREAHRDTVAT